MEKKGDINFLSEQSNLKQIGKQLLKIIKRVSNGVENILYYFIDVGNEFMGNSEPTTDEIKQIEEIIKDFFPQQNYGNGDSRDIAPIRLVIKSKIRELFRSIENYFSDDRTLENCVLNNYMNKILTLLKYKELLRLDDETVTDLTIKLEKITNKFFHTLQDNTDTEHNNDDIMTVIRGKVTSFLKDIEAYLTNNTTFESNTINDYTRKIATLLKHKEFLELDNKTVNDLRTKSALLSSCTKSK